MCECQDVCARHARGNPGRFLCTRIVTREGRLRVFCWQFMTHSSHTRRPRSACVFRRCACGVARAHLPWRWGSGSFTDASSLFHGLLHVRCHQGTGFLEWHGHGQKRLGFSGSRGDDHRRESLRYDSVVVSFPEVVSATSHSCVLSSLVSFRL